MWGDGEARSSDEAANSGGAKEPQFKDNATSNTGPENGDEPINSINVQKLQKALHAEAKGSIQVGLIGGGQSYRPCRWLYLKTSRAGFRELPETLTDALTRQRTFRLSTIQGTLPCQRKHER